MKLVHTFVRLCVWILAPISLAACTPNVQWEDAERRAEQVEADFNALFEQVEFVQTQYDRTPSLVYSGRSAKIVARTKVEPLKYRSNAFLNSQKLLAVQAHGLARTHNGRWFVFTLFCGVDEKVGTCDSQDIKFRPESEERAKSWLWSDRELFSVELYRQLFGEEPPPHKIQA